MSPQGIAQYRIFEKEKQQEQKGAELLNQNLLTAKAAEKAHKDTSDNIPKQRIIMGLSAGGTIAAAIIGLSSLYINITLEKERKREQQLLILQQQIQKLDSLWQIQRNDTGHVRLVETDTSKKDSLP